MSKENILFEPLANVKFSDTEEYERAMLEVSRACSRQDDAYIPLLIAADAALKAAKEEHARVFAGYDEQILARVREAKKLVDSTPELQNETAVEDLYSSVTDSYSIGRSDQMWRFGGFPKESDIPRYYPSADGYFEGIENGKFASQYPKVPVVYELFQNNELVYVGSTGNFSNRVKAHKRDKIFDYWVAYPYPTEGEARGAEDSYLRAAEKLPKYNRRASA